MPTDALVSPYRLPKHLPFWVLLGVLSGMGLFPCPRVAAHPHIFIVQRLNLTFDDKGLAGIGVNWLFDDMFTSMILEDHDRNADGRLEPSEIETIKAQAFDYIAEFNYFVFITIGNRPFTVKFIKDFNASLSDGKLIYEFFIPCHVTAVDTPKKIKISTYDPTYYSAIFFAANGPVALTEADAYEIKAATREDPDTKIYFDMIHPWTLFLEFCKKR
jgi:ABC-type uncharacterized transport system substrate-binding protein